jgi:predicted nucleic acid-binding protein
VSASTRAFLDTNVLVYAYDSSSPGKQAWARELIEALVNDEQALLSTQVLQEFYVVVTRKLRVSVPEDVAQEAVKTLLALPIIQVTPALIVDSIRRSRVDQLALWDALIVEAALAGGASVLYSEDLQDGRRFTDLMVVNPFRDVETTQTP